ncbi:toxic anion resistance protein [Litorivita sp. NS0012-18]
MDLAGAKALIKLGTIMTETTRAKAEATLKQVEEITAVVLPEPKDANAIVPLEQADAPVSGEITRRMAELDMSDTNSIVAFGSAAQAELQEISQAMLADVRNKDVGPAGDSLRNIVTTIRGFSISELDVRRERSWWEKLLGRAAPFAKFTARFEEVQSQIDRVTDDLLGHEHTLLKDIKSLDLLYEKTLNFYDELALYIAAGEAKLRALDEVDIPAKEAAVAAAPEADQVMAAQELRDLRAARDDLERRVHDLKLTRQVTMQSLPSIRLVQENDKSLVTKINSTLVNTVPLWETQLAQAVTIQRSAEAAAAVRDANDLTNELLTANAKNLRESNKIVREEMERGVFDIEAVKAANADLVATIEESLAIADEGKARRKAAEVELKTMEANLRDTLAAAKARKSGTGETIATAVPKT